MQRAFLCQATLLLAVIAADPASAAESIGKDLKATIALHGHACDAIAKTQRNGDSDYTATCKDGNRYHVFIDPQGRVVVQKL